MNPCGSTEAVHVPDACVVCLRIRLNDALKREEKAIKALGELWEWQKDVQELPPDALSQNVQRILRKAKR